MSRINSRLALLATLVSSACFNAPAQAACYELIGCTDGQYYTLQNLRQLSCENLWYVRNSIYDENGYCFRTNRAMQSFSNADCFVSNQAQVALNDFERTNVNRIVRVEREFGCP